MFLNHRRYILFTMRYDSAVLWAVNKSEYEYEVHSESMPGFSTMPSLASIGKSNQKAAAIAIEQAKYMSSSDVLLSRNPLELPP